MHLEEPFVAQVLGAAHAEGMGEIREESIELVGARLGELRVKWKPADVVMG